MSPEDKSVPMEGGAESPEQALENVQAALAKLAESVPPAAQKQFQSLVGSFQQFASSLEGEGGEEEEAGQGVVPAEAGRASVRQAM